LLYFLAVGFFFGRITKPASKMFFFFAMFCLKTIEL
jgi:hypothetical protein